MPKVGMEPIRRRQIIDAVMDCIHTDGLEHASLKAIAKSAGVAPSLILHYFGDKNAVLAAVYRDLYVRLGAATRVRRKEAKDPAARLQAILEAQVSAEMIAPRVVSTWFAISALARNTPGLARLERINTKRLTSNIVFELRSLGFSRAEAHAVSSEFLALIYGLWNLLAHGSLVDSRDAREILVRCLKARLYAELQTTPV